MVKQVYPERQVDCPSIRRLSQLRSTQHTRLNKGSLLRAQTPPFHLPQLSPKLGAEELVSFRCRLYHTLSPLLAVAHPQLRHILHMCPTCHPPKINRHHSPFSRAPHLPHPHTTCTLLSYIRAPHSRVTLQDRRRRVYIRAHFPSLPYHRHQNRDCHRYLPSLQPIPPLSPLSPLCLLPKRVVVRYPAHTPTRICEVRWPPTLIHHTISSHRSGRHPITPRALLILPHCRSRLTPQSIVEP